MRDGRVARTVGAPDAGADRRARADVTFVASEALAVVTVMPVVARDLGGFRLYGWVFSAFMLGSVVGIVAPAGRPTGAGPRSRSWPG